MIRFLELKNRWEWEKAFFHFVIPVAFVILIVAVYGKSYEYDFVWDDRSLIVENPHIRSAKKILYLFSPSYWNKYHPGTKGQYRPLRTATFSINYILGRYDPSGYHIFNFVIHILVVLSLYYFIRVLTNSYWLASLACLFYAVFPSHCENVVWVKNRSEMLAALFVILSMALFVRFFQTKRAARKIVSVLLLSGSLISYFLAFGGKENSIILTPLLILYLFCYAPRSKLRDKILSLLPYIIITLGYALMQIFVLSKVDPDLQQTGYTFWGNLSQISMTILHYIRFLLFPYPLNADRGDSPIKSYSLVPAIPIALLLLMCVYFFYRWRTKQPFICYSVFWIVLSLAPISNIISITGRPLADQRLYIPALGFCMLLAAIIHNIKVLTGKYFGNKWANALSFGISGIIIFGYLLIIVPRVQIWKNDFTLWKETTNSEITHGRPYHNLGLAYMREQDYSNAEKYLKMALEISPHNNLVYSGLGQLFFKIGKYDEAITMLRDAISLAPNYPAPYNSLGEIYVSKGDLNLAEASLKMALKIDPSSAETNCNLGAIYMRQGNHEEAMKYFTSALDYDPNNVKTHIYLSILHLLRNDTQKALKEYSKSLELGLTDLNTLLYLARGFFEKGEQNVLKEYLKDADITRMDDLNSMLILGEIFAVTEDYQKAASQLRLALEKDPLSSLGHALLGKVYQKMNDLQKSLQEFEKAYSLDPDNNEISFDIGCLYLQLNRSKKASVYIGQYLEYFPSSRNGRLKLAEALCQQGSYEKALQILGKLKSEIPDSVEVSLALVKVYENMGENLNVVKEYKRAIRIKPQMASLHFNLAVSYEELDQVEEAEKFYKEAIMLDPFFFQSLFNFGILCFKQQRFDESLKYFQRALSISENSKECRTYISLIYFIQGRHDLAKKEVLILIAAGYRKEYNLIFDYIIDRKLGKKRMKETLVFDHHTGHVTWPSLLVKFFADIIGEAELKAHLRAQPKEKQQGLKYELDFYSAMKLIDNGKYSEGRIKLENCIHEKRPGVLEYYLALAELAQQ